MTDEKQTTFDFDALNTNMVLGVSEFEKDDLITVRKDIDGFCLKSVTVEGTNSIGEKYNFDQILLNISRNDNDEVMRLSKSTAKKLGQFCKKDQAKLAGKKFLVGFKGKGKFKYIDLILTS